MNAPITGLSMEDRAGWSRTERLFVGTAAMLLVGILLPWSAAMLDILWILHLSLTAAVILTCLGARNTSQLDGFPLLTAGASMLSFLTVAGCLRAVVFHRQACGRLVEMLGEALTSFEPLLALLSVFILGFLLLYLVRLAGKRMHAAVEDYFFRILPFKRAGLETDRSLQLLSEEQARLLADKIQREVRFYASMEQIRKLLLAQITVHLFLLLTAWPLAWTAEWLQSASSPSGLSPLAAAAAALTGTALLAWIPPASAAAACAALLSKDSLALPRADSAEQSVPSRTIRIQSSVSGRTEEIEILNPQSLQEPPKSTSVPEQVADFEPSGSSDSSLPFPEIRSLTFEGTCPEDYYAYLAELFSRPEFRRSYLLLTSESVKDLPVHTAVHPALHLARQKQKVLLLDADPRNAAAKVFALRPEMLTVPTAVPRLNHLWLQSIQLEEWMQKTAEVPADDSFCRLIYAPQKLPLPSPPPSRADTSASAVRIVFFSPKPPEQVRPLFAGWPCIYLLAPLWAACKTD
ncbi:MAG: hypothetical protein WHS88_03720 [Anaerohalosphaeraceae bacterium]